MKILTNKFGSYTTTTDVAIVKSIEDNDNNILSTMYNTNTDEVLGEMLVVETEYTGGFLTENGTITGTSSNGYTTDYIEVDELYTVYVDASAGWSGRAYAFFDKDKKCINVYPNASGQIESTVFTKLKVTVPLDVKYIRVSLINKSQLKPVVYKKNSSVVINQLKQDVYNEDWKHIPASEISAGYGYITKTGEGLEQGKIVSMTDQNYIYTQLIKINKTDKYKLSLKSMYSGCGIAIYDLTNKCLGTYYYKEYVDGNTLYNEVFDFMLVFETYPSAAYVRFATADGTLVVEKTIDIPVSNEVSIKSFKDVPYITIMTNKYLGWEPTKGSVVPVGDTLYQCTNPVKINRDDKYLLTAVAKYATCCYAIYKKDMTCIEAFGYNTDKTRFEYKNEILDCESLLTKYPEAYYIRFGSAESALNILVYSRDSVGDVANSNRDRIATLEDKYTENILRNKYYLACGDSFTEGSYLEFDKEYQSRKSYPWYIAKRNKMKLKNVGKSSQYMYNADKMTNPQLSANCFAYTYKSLSNEISVADYMTIALGLNDSITNIGTKTDYELSSTFGCWNNVLSDIYEWNPDIKLGLIINDSTTMVQAKRDALISVANWWGIPYIDLRNGEQYTSMIGGRLNNTVNPYVTSKRESVMKVPSGQAGEGHPTAIGMEFRSTIIENFIRSL